MKASRILTAEPVRHKAAQGRVCAAPGCETRLSVYNLGRYCGVHEDREEPPVPERVCTACGETHPLTADYWRRDVHNPEGFKARCKRCDRRAEAAAYRDRHGRRTCAVCKQRKWLTTRHWRKSRTNGGWSLICRGCEDAIAAEREGRKVTVVGTNRVMHLEVSA